MKNLIKRDEEIYEAYVRGEPVDSITKRYKLSRSSIYRICSKIRREKNPDLSGDDELFQLCKKHSIQAKYSQPVRIYNALRRHQCNSIEDLKTFPVEKIETMRNIGSLGCSVIKNMILEVSEPKEPPVLKMSLCEARHITLEKDGSIFPYIISDITNIEDLELNARDRIWQACYEKYRAGKRGYFISKQKEFSKELMFDPRLHIDLYVTGLTVALVSVINVCIRENIGLTLWYYDRNKGDYYPQKLSHTKQ